MSHGAGRFEEKRKAKRQALRYYLRVFNGGENRILGRVVNISSRGLMLTGSGLQTDADFLLRIQLAVIIGELLHVQVPGTWLWSRRNDDSVHSLNGFRFRALPASVSREIGGIIDRFSLSA